MTDTLQQSTQLTFMFRHHATKANPSSVACFCFVLLFIKTCPYDHVYDALHLARRDVQRLAPA